MRLGRLGYYADFVVYPLTVTGLAAAGLYSTDLARWPNWLAAFVGGFAIWTLAEYLLHRYVLHHLPWIKDMHEAHHADQMALVGTPTWLSFVIVVAFVFAPLYAWAGLLVATGITAGVTLGYLSYVGVHHMVHHMPSKPGSYLTAMKRRHMLHHHFDEERNFGVSSGFWDRVFHTDVTSSEAAAARR